MIVRANATLNSKRLPHGPRPTSTARIAIESPSRAIATSVKARAKGAAAVPTSPDPARSSSRSLPATAAPRTSPWRRRRRRAGDRGRREDQRRQGQAPVREQDGMRDVRHERQADHDRAGVEEDQGAAGHGYRPWSESGGGRIRRGLRRREGASTAASTRTRFSTFRTRPQLPQVVMAAVAADPAHRADHGQRLVVAVAARGARRVDERVARAVGLAGWEDG